MSIVLQAAFDTLSTACIYALIAVGFTMIFGVTRVMNIAYGDILAIGAYMGFIIVPSTAVSFLWGFPASVLSVGVLCILLERFIYRRTYARPLNGFLVSLGLVQVIETTLQWLYAYHPPHIRPVVQGVVQFHGVFMTEDNFIVIGGTFVILVGLMLFLERTRAGLSFRAIANDGELAGMMGVPVSRYVTGIFFIAGMLAGAGGSFVALLGTAGPFLGASYMIRGLIVALVGGLGSVRGALIAAVVVATVESVIVWSLVWIHADIWLDPIEFGLAIVLLLFRPQGLIGGVTNPLTGSGHQSTLQMR